MSSPPHSCFPSFLYASLTPTQRYSQAALLLPLYIRASISAPNSLVLKQICCFALHGCEKNTILEGSIPEIQIPALPNGETSGRPLNLFVPCFSSISRDVMCLAGLLSSHTHGKQLVNSRHTVEAQKCLFPLPFKINVRHGQKKTKLKYKDSFKNRFHFLKGLFISL